MYIHVGCLRWFDKILIAICIVVVLVTLRIFLVFGNRQLVSRVYIVLENIFFRIIGHILFLYGGDTEYVS